MTVEFSNYSDEQLWAVVHQRLERTQDQRLHELIEVGKSGKISEDEKLELERLINVVDQQMLLRSQALALLKQRGHDVESYLTS